MPIAQSMFATAARSVWPAPGLGGALDYFGYLWGINGPITSALNATGGGTRYDVYSDADLDLIPWNALTAGSVVNIFWKLAPYKRNFGLRSQGTSSDWIIVNGVTDATGDRPVLDFNGSTTAANCNSAGAPPLFTGSDPTNDEALGGIVIARARSIDAYGSYSPKYIQIRNLRLNGAVYSSSFTTITGATYNRGPTQGSAGLWVQLVEHFLAFNNVIDGNSNGIFTMTKDGLFSEACKWITLRGNKVFDNGIPGSYFRHNCYLQCHEPIVEGNYFGEQVAGALGSCFKSRSSFDIIRYNHFRNAARCIDIVEAQEQDTDGIPFQSSYGPSFVYGNVLDTSADHRQSAGEPIQFGGDSLGLYESSGYVNGTDEALAFARGRKNLYFFNNTFRAKYTSAQAYSFRVFSATLPGVRIDGWDNLFQIEGNCNASWLEFSGDLHLWGTNVLSHSVNNPDYGTGTPITNVIPGGSAGWYSVTNHGTLLTGASNLSNPVGGDFTLGAGSAGENITPWTPTGLPASWVDQPVVAQLKGVGGGYGMVARSTKTDLGALERGVY